MARSRNEKPTRIQLSEDAHSQLSAAIQRFMSDEFDQSLSPFQAQRLVDFLVRRLGAPVYNQAIQDARTFLQGKLDELDGEFYEPEDPR